MRPVIAWTSTPVPESLRSLAPASWCACHTALVPFGLLPPCRHLLRAIQSAEHLACLQAVLFANDTTVSKGMVKYASTLSRESLVDLEGTVVVPREPVASCSQTHVS